MKKKPVSLYVSDSLHTSTRCETGNCIAGYIGATLVKEKDWQAAYDAHQLEIAHFNTTRKAVPHPGFSVRANYCQNCGRKLPVFHEKEYPNGYPK